MSIRRSILAVALALAALFGLLVPVPPANAGHAFGHWRSDWFPVVTTPACVGSACDLVQDAAYYWQDRGYYKGYVPPLPRTGYDCEPNWGEISVCFVNWGDPRLNGETGHNTAWYMDSWAHIGAARIFVCGNCGNFEAQRTLRHEFGHALGLDHIGDPSCVMYAPVQVLGETCFHDYEQMASMYSHRD